MNISVRRQNEEYMKIFVVSFLSLYTLKIYRMCIVKLYEDLILDTVAGAAQEILQSLVELVRG